MNSVLSRNLDLTLSRLLDGRAAGGGSPPAFSPNDLNPYLYLLAGDSVIKAGGGAAAYLDSVATWTNLADGSNAASDAAQTTALDQPSYLPLIDGAGYLHCPGIDSNGATLSNPITIGSGQVFDLTFEVYGVSPGHLVASSNTDRIFFSGTVFHFGTLNTPCPFPQGRVTINVTRNAANLISVKYDGVLQCTLINSASQTWSHVGYKDFATGIPSITGAVLSITGSIGGVAIDDIDFTDPSDPHNDTSILDGGGNAITIDQTGDNPATLVRVPSLRGDGVNSWMDGTFASAIAGGRMFAAFTVLGGGGLSFGKVFSVNETGANITAPGGAAFLERSATTSQSTLVGSPILQRASGYSGTALHEVSLQGSAHKSLLDGAAEITDSTPSSIVGNEFNIMARDNGAATTAIDLHALYLLPPTITESEATQCREHMVAALPNIGITLP